MTEQSRQPKDKNYNIISALYQAADNVEMFKSYINDAEEDNDQERSWSFSTRFWRTILEPPSNSRSCW
jgi:hypothetical protein